MTLPSEVPTVTLTYGAHINAAKRPLQAGKMYIIQQLERTHIESGTFIDQSPVVVDLAGGVAVGEPVVASDAEGFNVDGMTPYTIKFDGLVAFDGTPLKRPALVNVILPASVPVIDVDLMTSGTTQQGVVVTFPSVIGVGGLTGSVSAEDLFGILEPFVAEGLAEKLDIADAITEADVAAKIATLKAWAKDVDNLIAGAITYTSGLVSSALVEWPDGKPGVLTITARQSGTDAVTNYKVTRVDGSTTTTYTQPTITRDSSGNATSVPQITVA